VKQKSIILSLALVLGTGLSCDMNPTRPATTGSISIVLLTPSGAAFKVNAQGDESATGDLQPMDARASIALQGARLIVTGPTNKTVSTTSASGANFTLTADGLAPGTYAVTVEGLANGQVAHFGQTTGITVTAGVSTPATVSFPVFQPQVPNAAVVDTSDVLHFTVTWDAVTSATSYLVEWSQSPTMASPSSKTVTGATTTDVTVTQEGKYYFTVRAVNAAVSTGGLASPTKGVYVFQGVATVTVTPATPVLVIGGTQQMAAEARDGDNAVVNGVNYLWVSSDPSVAKVSASGLVTAVGGGQATIFAVGKGTPGNTSVTVNATAARLAFSIQPANATAGDPLSPAVQVEIQDAGGNRITTARDPVTVTFANNAGGGVLTGTKTVNAVNGIASFSGLSINKSAAGYTLSASSGGLTAATSTAFTIAAAAPAKLGFTAQPVNAQGNVAMGSAVTASIFDAFDNVVRGATNPVTLSIGTNPWKGLVGLGGNVSATLLTVSAVDGLATFNNVRVDKPAVGYTLAVSSPSLATATSASFNVNITVTGSLNAGSQASHSCALTTGGTYCWGNNSSGQLGALTGLTTFDSIPALVRGGLTFTSVSTGNAHSCGLTAAGAAYCWGVGSVGRLGNGGNANSDVPVPVSGGHVFQQVDVGGAHACGLTTASATPAEDRQVYCWGSNGNGALGDGTFNTPTVPVQVAEPLRTTFRATSISAGANHTCAISDNGPGAAYCWGFGGSGQVGEGGFASPNVPTLVVGGFTYTAISAGVNHTCGLSPTGPTTTVARCWGFNGSGGLGDGTNTTVASPVLVAGAFTTWTRITAGGQHSCGIASGIALCWGLNSNGELGDDNQNGANTNTPTPVAGNLTLVAIDAGANHTCGRTASAVYCWGTNSVGRLGSPGVNQIKRAPTQIIQ
jgi:alpha-tubulin suppressor-like RCC1 family protein